MRFSLISALKSVLSGTDLNTPLRVLESTSSHSHASLWLARSSALLILNCALDFSRTLDDKQKVNKNIFHHIGIYVYKTKILEKIVKLKQSKNEIKNKLEQLRATDNDIKINVALAKFSSIGVDTMEDYLELKKILEYKS